MDKKITLETIDAKFDVMDRRFESIDKKIDQKFGLLDNKIDVMAIDIVDIKHRMDTLEENISREIRDSAENLKFVIQKFDGRLNDKVSYKELELKMAS